MQFTYHIPGAVDADPSLPFEFTTRDEMLNAERVKNFKDNYPNFHRYSINTSNGYGDQLPTYSLMAEYVEGREWWVVGFIKGTSEEIASLDLPRWTPNKGDYKPLAQRDQDEMDRLEARKFFPKQGEVIGVSITVYDETPDRIVFGLMDDWEQFFNLDESHQDLLTKVSQHTFEMYKSQEADNANLLRMAQEVHRFMQEHYPKRYTGRVRVRRGGWRNGERFYRYVN